MRKINITIPYSLVTANGDYRKFLLTTYIYFYLRCGADGIVYSNLSNILSRGCGYSKNMTSVRKKTIYKQLKQAIQFMQEKEYIGYIIDEDTGEIIDINDATPEQSLVFDVATTHEMMRERFGILSYNDYMTIKNTRSPSFWKMITVYMFFVVNTFFSTGEDISQASYWSASYKKLSETLQDEFSERTMITICKTLQDLNLISMKPFYWQTDDKKRPPLCLGNVFIVNGNSSSKEIEDRLYEAYYDAKHSFIEYRRQNILEDAAETFAEKGA